MKSDMMRVFLIAVALLTSTTAIAAEEEVHAPNQDWSFEGPFGVFDRASLQRGYQVYREVCAACHSMDYMYFRMLGQEGGPFHDEDYPNPNDNPVIKALSAEFQIEDGPDDLGDMFMRPGQTSDRFPAPYPNDNAARAANGGAHPPDLSVIVKARGGGADYLDALLTGYKDAPEGEEPPRAGLYYNEYFAGHWIAMPPQLTEGRVTYEDGTEATPEQMAEDVTTFLAWASEPHMETRKRMGFGVIIFLIILSGLTFLAYKEVWRDVEH